MKSKLGARLGLAALAAGPLFAPALAHAADTGPDTLPINVVSIEGNDAEDQAEALTKALRAAVRAAPGWSLAPGDFSLEVIVLSLKCPDPPDLACQARIADEIKADRYVWGWLKKKGPNVGGELGFWVRGKGTTKIPFQYSANLTEANEEALKRVARESLQQLTGGPPKGGLSVHAGNIPGQLFIDGQPMGALINGSSTLQVASGTHSVTVKAQGYADAETQQIMVKPNATAEVNLSLHKEDTGGKTPPKRLAGYIALGAGIGAAIGGGISWGLYAKTQSDYNTFAQDPPKGVKINSPPCPNTDPQVNPFCSKAFTFSTLAWTLTGVGVGAAGVGTFLIFTSPSSSKAVTGFQVTPSAGPYGGSINLKHDF